MGELSMYQNSEGPMAGVVRRLGWLRDGEGRIDQTLKLTEKTKDIEQHLKGLKRNIEDLSSSANDLKALLSQIDKSFSQTNRVVKFLIFGWYLTFPLVIASGAIGMLFSELWL